MARKKNASGEGSWEKIRGKWRLVRMIDRQVLKGPLRETKPLARTAWNEKFQTESGRAKSALTLSSAISKLFPAEGSTPWKTLALRRWRATTYDINRRQSVTLAKSKLAGLRLRSIDANAIARFIEKDCADLQPKTIRHKLGLLQAIFSFAGVPWPKVKLPELGPPQKRKIVPIEKREEFYALAANEMEDTAFRLMLGCGLRVSEACGLDHSDREDDGIWIRRAVTRQTGTNNVDLPKTKNSHRWVPLVDPVLLERIGKGKGFVLDSGNDGHPVNPSMIGSLMPHRTKGTKFEGIMPHDLRRSTATAYVKAKVPVNVAAKNLGHSIAMMLEVYAQVSRDDERKAAEDALGKSVGQSQVESLGS